LSDCFLRVALLHLLGLVDVRFVEFYVVDVHIPSRFNVRVGNALRKRGDSIKVALGPGGLYLVEEFLVLDPVQQEPGLAG
jgi:hypothetical protein